MPLHDTLLVAAICVSALSVLLLGIGAVVASARLKQLAVLLESSLKQIQEETVNTLQTTQDTLVRVEELTKNLDKLVVSEVGPALTAARDTLRHVESATRAVSESACGVRAIVGSVQAVAKPASFAATATRILAEPASRTSMLALAIGAVVKALVASRHSTEAGKTVGATTSKGDG